MGYSPGVSVSWVDIYVPVCFVGGKLRLQTKFVVFDVV